MKKILVGCLAIVGIFWIAPVLSDGMHPMPDAHAPAGVMVDHLHGKGGAMAALRYQRTSAGSLYRGGDRVSADDLAAAGYSMMATDMTMDMFMLDLMYAPTDKLTLMLMPHYMRMDMTMAATGMMMDPDDEHHGHGDAHHGSHGVSGVGDTLVTALYQLASGEQHQLIGALGVSAPTGSVDQKNPDGSFVHYGMQLGSGTWDLAPALTYKGRAGLASWGVQVNGLLRLESENSSGYLLGDKYRATAWGAWRMAEWISLSARLAYEHEDSIGGHYNGPHAHSSPADLQGNYGGEFVDAGVGANMVVTQGGFAGLRLELEWVKRIDEDYNGFQLGQDNVLNAAVSYAF